MDKKLAVIVGAGPAGLTAAHELLAKANEFWDVTVLEAHDNVGGISRTVNHNGNRMDLGGHRFFSKDQRIVEWWQKRLPLQGSKSFDDLALGRDCVLTEGGPDPELENRVMLNRQRVSRIYYDGKFFDYPVSLNPRTLQTMGPMTTARTGISYIASNIKKLPEENLENFYINRFGRVLYQMFFEGYTQKLWGRHPREISADWGSQRVKGLSISAVLKDAVRKLGKQNQDEALETSLIRRFSYPKLGPGQLWDQVEHEIVSMGGSVIKNAKVTNIVLNDDGFIQAVCCSNGQEFMADSLMTSMPLCDLVAAMPDATSDAVKIANGLPYRELVTVGVLVPELAIKNKTNIRTLGNIVPDNWIYVQDSSVRMGRIQVFNNWSPYLVADPLRSVWLGLEYFCAEGDEIWNLSDVDRISLAVRELSSMGIVDPRIEVLDAHVERVPKAYPAYFDTYNRIGELREWLDSHPNLFCIGRNGQHRYNNMDHSMLTAFNAVSVLLSGSTDRSSVWNVNTEADYHESSDASAS